ncbi:MAG: site-specific DNA-methyltransferase [Terriglobia bacterium]
MGLQAILPGIPKTVRGFRDTAFTKNRELPLHRWVPWVAGFSAQFVDDCLEKYVTCRANGNTWVLDPFAGVGTTLVQGYLHGYNVAGFEINPYAALASRLKLEATEVSAREFERYVAAFGRFMEGRCPDYGKCNGEPRSSPPEGFKGRSQLFSPAVERRVLTILDFIEGIKTPLVADLFRLALGSVMVSVSNYSYEPSLTRRVAVDKPEIEDAPVAGVLSSKLRLMVDDVQWLQRSLRRIGHLPERAVIPNSFFSAAQNLRKTKFVDLVVTSPPYLNNYHYPRNTRPQLHWLGLASGSGYKGAREDESFGKFWQTVRDRPPIELAFRFPALEEVIETIRKLNTARGSYGGAGWANYAATYFNDTYRFCVELGTLLRPEAVAVIVLGNSIIQGVEIKTDCFFGEIAELCGFAFEDNFLIRQKRTGNSIIQSSVRVDKAAYKAALYESAIVIRKK